LASCLCGIALVIGLVLQVVLIPLMSSGGEGAGHGVHTTLGGGAYTRDRPGLVAPTRASSVPAELAHRLPIVLAADGVSNTEIASRVGVSRLTLIG
jgi:hypothetical protein